MLKLVPNILKSCSVWQFCLYKCCTSLTQWELSSICLMALYETPVDLTGRLRGGSVKSQVRSRSDLVCKTTATELPLWFHCWIIAIINRYLLTVVQLSHFSSNRRPLHLTAKELRNKAKCNVLVLSSALSVSAFPAQLASDCLSDCLIVTRISKDGTLWATDIMY